MAAISLKNVQEIQQKLTETFQEVTDVVATSCMVIAIDYFKGRRGMTREGAQEFVTGLWDWLEGG